MITHPGRKGVKKEKVEKMEDDDDEEAVKEEDDQNSHDSQSEDNEDPEESDIRDIRHKLENLGLIFLLDIPTTFHMIFRSALWSHSWTVGLGKLCPQSSATCLSRASHGFLTRSGVQKNISNFKYIFVDWCQHGSENVWTGIQ